MQRIPLNPRDNWQQKVESVGLTFHTLENGTPYWDESAAYQFTAAEIDTLEAAGNTLQEMCLAAAQHIIDNRRFADLVFVRPQDRVQLYRQYQQSGWQAGA